MFWMFVLNILQTEGVPFSTIYIEVQINSFCILFFLQGNCTFCLEREVVCVLILCALNEKRPLMRKLVCENICHLEKLSSKIVCQPSLFLNLNFTHVTLHDPKLGSIQYSSITVIFFIWIANCWPIWPTYCSILEQLSHDSTRVIGVAQNEKLIT